MSYITETANLIQEFSKRVQGCASMDERQTLESNFFELWLEIRKRYGRDIDQTLNPFTVL